MPVAGNVINPLLSTSICIPIIVAFVVFDNPVRPTYDGVLLDESLMFNLYGADTTDIVATCPRVLLFGA